MKIDFHTHYRRESFDGLCKKAISMGLEGLVVEGLPRDYPITYESLGLFPAREVDFVAAMEIPTFTTEEEYRDDARGTDKTYVFKGKVLILLPDKESHSANENRLFQILDLVSRKQGIVIALQDDINSALNHLYRGEYRPYNFDAIRIRPYNSHDVHSELPFAKVAVTGSDANCGEEIGPGKGYTFYNIQINNQEELLRAIKNRAKNQLRVFTGHCGSYIKIEDSVRPLKISVDNYSKRIFNDKRSKK